LLLAVAAKAEATHVSVFKIYLDGRAWEKAVVEKLPAMRPRNRVLYQRRPKQRGLPLELPDGFRLRAIDRALLETTNPANHDLLLDEIRGGWPSIERFLERGFGTAIWHE
jgi:hypothetical protein